MPLYDYCCSDCGHKFEKLVVSVKSPHPRKCPKCGKLKLKRLAFTRPAIVLMKYSPMHPRARRGMCKR